MPVGFGGQGVTVDESFVDKLVGLLDDAISRSKTEKAFVFSKRWGGADIPRAVVAALQKRWDDKGVPVKIEYVESMPDGTRDMRNEDNYDSALVATEKT